MVRLLNVFVLIIALVPPRLCGLCDKDDLVNGVCMTGVDVQEVC